MIGMVEVIGSHKKAKFAFQLPFQFLPTSLWKMTILGDVSFGEMCLTTSLAWNLLLKLSNVPVNTFFFYIQKIMQLKFELPSGICFN